MNREAREHISTRLQVCAHTYAETTNFPTRELIHDTKYDVDPFIRMRSSVSRLSVTRPVYLCFQLRSLFALSVAQNISLPSHRQPLGNAKRLLTASPIPASYLVRTTAPGTRRQSERSMLCRRLC